MATLLSATMATVSLSALGPRYGGEIAVVVPALPAAFDPAVPGTATDRLVLALVHETLISVAVDGLPRPALAESWTSSASGREWTLRLRDGAAFHDGSPVTARHAVRSLKRFLRSASPAASRLAADLDGGTAFREGRSEEIAGLDSADPARVVLRASGGAPVRLAALSAAAAAITGPQGSGAGPFVPTTPPGRAVTLVAFGAHVRGRPFLDRIRLAGAGATVPELEPTRIEVGEAAASADDPVLTMVLVLDPALPPLADVAARRRIAAAIDRAELARRFLPSGEPAGALLAPALLPPLPAPPIDPRAGEVRGRLSLRVATDVPVSASQRVVAHLGALGLEVDAVGAAPGVLFEGGPAARLLLWAPEVPEPTLALEELADRLGTAAQGFPTADVRSALDAARLATDPDRRRVALYRAEEALRAAHVLVPLAGVPVPLRVGAKVHGARADLGGRILLEDAWVEP